MPGEVLVDGVVENLEDTVVQAALVRIPDVHSGALANRLQPLEFIDLFGAVFLLIRDRDFGLVSPRFGVEA